MGNDLANGRAAERTRGSLVAVLVAVGLFQGCGGGAELLIVEQPRFTTRQAKIPPARPDYPDSSDEGFTWGQTDPRGGQYSGYDVMVTWSGTPTPTQAVRVTAEQLSPTSQKFPQDTYEYFNIPVYDVHSSFIPLPLESKGQEHWKSTVTCLAGGTDLTKLPAVAPITSGHNAASFKASLNSLAPEQRTAFLRQFALDGTLNYEITWDYDESKTADPHTLTIRVRSKASGGHAWSEWATVYKHH